MENGNQEETKIEEEKVKEDDKPMTLFDFLSHSFEVLFEQNRLLHSSLKDFLDLKLKEVQDKMETVENNLKSGYLFYQRDILQGLKESNEELYHHLHAMNHTPSFIPRVSSVENSHFDTMDFDLDFVVRVVVFVDLGPRARVVDVLHFHFHF